jgi:hypothetical protein
VTVDIFILRAHAHRAFGINWLYSDVLGPESFS